MPAAGGRREMSALDLLTIARRSAARSPAVRSSRLARAMAGDRSLAFDCPTRGQPGSSRSATRATISVCEGLRADKLGLRSDAWRRDKVFR